MTLKEYLDLKATGYHFDDFDQEITVNKPDGGTEKNSIRRFKNKIR